MRGQKCPSLPDVGDGVLPHSGNLQDSAWALLGHLCGLLGDPGRASGAPVALSPSLAPRNTGSPSPPPGCVSVQAAVWMASQRMPNLLTVPSPHCP